MKFLPLRILSSLLCLASMLFSSVSFAQTNCTKHLGGEITCTGPGGYQAEGRQHLGGTESWYDNKGNSATVRHDPFGGTSIDTTRTDSGSRAPVFIPPSLPTRSGTEAPKELVERTLKATSVPRPTEEYDYPQPVPDKSKLPKTPEEYRLSFLRTKAIEQKDFEKAEELRRLLWQEQFSNADAAGKVRMFNKERAEQRLEMMETFDRAEKRIRWENRPAKLATFHKFKERALISYDKHEAEADRVFYERLQEWKEEKEGNDRLAKFEADLASLRLLQLDASEYQKREDELSEQWGKAEDEQKQRITAALNARLDRLIAEEAIQRKVKNKKVTAK